MAGPVTFRRDPLANVLDQRFRKPLMSYFLRRVGSRAEAEDLTQDVFVRLLDASDRRVVPNVEALMFVTAANLLKDRARKTRRRAQYGVSGIDEAAVSTVSREFIEERDPERVFLGRETIVAMLEALDELGERTRDIYILFRLENMKQAEIAALFNVNRGAVEKDVMRATTAWEVGQLVFEDESLVAAAARVMGERGDIIRTLQRAITANRLERAPGDVAIAAPASMTPIVGKVVERGLADEVNDRHYLIVDATDGRVHYVDIGTGAATDLIPTGSVVRIAPRPTEARAVDRTVAAVAEANGGRYSVDLHLRHDASATQVFAETHVRRLEAMRKLAKGVDREPDGSWVIAPDHVARAAAYEASRAKATPVVIDTLSPIPIERQVGADGATWLDRELAAARPEPLRASGFGAEVAAAKVQRQRWLLGQDLADESQGQIVLRANLLTRLRQRELRRVAGQLSDELGMPYAETGTGDRVEGIYKRPVDLASGRYALIEKSREFTLVPWRPVLDRHLDQPVSGIMKGNGINWTVGRGRGGPSVS